MEELLKEKYYILLYEYLFKETSLMNYDNAFTSSNLKYEKTKEELKDEYQKKSILNYFYIRNIVYLSNIIDKQEELEKINSTTDYEIKKKFVEDTLKSVLKNPKVGDEYLIPYGPIGNYDSMVKNGTLVIGFRYDDFFEYDDNDDSWADNLDAQEDEIYEILPKIEQEISEKIKIPTKVIQYTDGIISNENGMTM